MKRFLQRFLDRVIKVGNLKITFADGTQSSFGDGSGVPVHARFKSGKAEREVVLDPQLKLAEAYMDGELDFPEGDIYRFLELIFENSGAHVNRSSLWMMILGSARHIAMGMSGWNGLRRSRANVQSHYDLSGELYDLFLDPDRQYSCAYFQEPDFDLEQAQMAKKRHIAAKLVMNREGLRALDIGSGWGGMALHLASHFNAQVTGVTLSDEQYAVSNERAREDGFAGQVDFRLQDYRQLEEKYDRIVSVGMFEHVGRKNYRTFFDKCADLLKPDGVMLLHTIGQHLPPSPTNPFIKKHIFPGGYIPSLSDMVTPIEHSGLVITDIEVLRMHYAETLKAWRARFLEHWDEAAALYDERFCRMWNFYLAGSEIAFRFQGLVVFQIQLTHDLTTVPITRDYIAKSEKAPHRARKATASARRKKTESAER